MSPLPKIPMQGDAQRLAQVASGLKREGGTYGAVVQRNPTGRPTGSTGTPAPRASQPQSGPVAVAAPTQQAYRDLAQAEVAKQYWAMMAQRFPGPRTEYYLTRSEKLVDELSKGVYNATPNVEW